MPSPTPIDRPTRPCAAAGEHQASETASPKASHRILLIDSPCLAGSSLRRPAEKAPYEIIGFYVAASGPTLSRGGGLCQLLAAGQARTGPLQSVTAELR